jgi:hypothetical protein
MLYMTSTTASKLSMFTVCYTFSSHDGFMSYMMDHPNNLPENIHFVGQVGQPHNNPIDIESEDANKDGDGVRNKS